MVHEPTLADRMTPELRKALSAARDSSQRMGHGFIGPEHLLLGLIEAGDGAAPILFAEFGCQPTLMKADIESRLERGPTDPERRSLPFTPRSRLVLENSIQIAQQLAHAEFGTGHALFALAAVPDSIAFDILLRHRIPADGVRRMLSDRGGWEWPFEAAPDDLRLRLATLRRAVAVLIAMEEHGLADQIGRLPGHSVQP